MDFVAIDFETANEKRSSPCSIGLAIVENGAVKESYQRLIRPHNDYFYFNPINESIHGIHEEDVEDEPELQDLWPWLEPFLEGQVVVAHNASFDFSVLRNTLALYGIEPMDCRIACTRAIAMASWPDLASYSLGVVADYLTIDFAHHKADEDAVAAAEIALKAIAEKGAGGIDRLPDFIDFRLGYIKQGVYECSGTSISTANKKRENALKRYASFHNNPIVPCDPNNPFFGNDLVFTGTLESMTRDVAFDLVQRVGGRASERLNKETEFLVMGIQDFSRFRQGCKSGKTKKAEKLRAQGYPIQIISEREFLEILGWGGK